MGSTAPIATSGVSTKATSLGGAVRIAARPNLTAKRESPPVDCASTGTGVLMRVEETLGVVGVFGAVALLTLKRPFLSETLETLDANED